MSQSKMYDESDKSVRSKEDIVMNKKTIGNTDITVTQIGQYLVVESETAEWRDSLGTRTLTNSFRSISGLETRVNREYELPSRCR